MHNNFTFGRIISNFIKIFCIDLEKRLLYKIVLPLVGKGLEIQRLIGSVVAGFNHARTITNASAKGLDKKGTSQSAPEYSLSL